MYKKLLLAISMSGGLLATQVDANGIQISPGTTVGGQMFFDFTNINQKSDGANTPANGTNLDVKRFYLSVNHNFDDIWSANLTTDFNYVSADSETQLYVKKAYLQAKLSDAFIARVGSSDLPWISYVEKLYGYRYVERLLLDRTSFGNTADWGLHLTGKLEGGLFDYAVSAVNGAGFKKLTRSKSVDFEGRIGFKPVQGLTLAVGGYTGKRGKNIEGTETYHTARRLDGTVAYGLKNFRLGVEYFKAWDWSNVTTITSDSSEGYGLWASYNINEKVSLFGRIDRVKPSKDIKPDLKENYFNGGISYSPRKNIDLALVYKRDKVDNGTFATQNGSIGGVNNGTYDEVGLFGAFSF